jgi:hypothetical protein
MSTLGIQPADIYNDYSISLFNKTPEISSIPQLPLSLQPTHIQISHPHHPWFDILPFPTLRDELISRQDEYDDTELCVDMLGVGGSHPVGLLVWRDPWDPYGWEMTEAFARKWMWLFKNCPELCSSTAYWRLQRDEPAIAELLSE